MEGLKVSDADLVVHIHPSKAKMVPEAILQELGSLLFNYRVTITSLLLQLHHDYSGWFSETFDGVVLAYDVNILYEVAKILPGILPYFGVRLRAKLLLFYPKPDMLLEGKVVKLSQQSIHVIVLGFSSAVILQEDIREEFNYKVKHGREIYASTIHKGHKIIVGTVIRFSVKSFDEEILYISGSLVPAHTGSIRWLAKNFEDSQHASSTTKKRKGSERTMELEEHDKIINYGEEFSVDTNHQSKKSKRQISNED